MVGIRTIRNGVTLVLLIAATSVTANTTPPVADLNAANKAWTTKTTTGDLFTMDADEAANKARKQYGGAVLSVHRVYAIGDPHYRIKLLDNGKVRVVRIPPEDKNTTDARTTD